MITWSKPRKWYVLSECGRYSISKAMVGAAPRYSAWRRATEKYAQDEFLGVTEAVEDAKAICDNHATRTDQG